MKHGIKRFVFLSIMGLAFAYFLYAVIHRQFLWVAVAVLVVILCVCVFLGMDSKDARKIAQMIASNQALDAKVEGWEIQTTEARGERYLLLLSFTINGVLITKGYEVNWDYDKAGLVDYKSKYPVGSHLSVLHDPKDLETLILQDSQHILSEVSNYTYKHFFGKTATQK